MFSIKKNFLNYFFNLFYLLVLLVIILVGIFLFHGVLAENTPKYYSSNYSSIEDAFISLSSQEDVILVVNSEHVLSQDFEISSNIALEFESNGKINLDEFNLTVNNSFTGPLETIFEFNFYEKGFLIAGNSFASQIIYPEWFGAIGNATGISGEGNNDYLSLYKMFHFASENMEIVFSKLHRVIGENFLPIHSHSYDCRFPLKNNQILRGVNENSGIFHDYMDSQGFWSRTILHINEVQNILIEGMTFIGFQNDYPPDGDPAVYGGTGEASGHLIIVENSSNISFLNNSLKNSFRGLVVSGHNIGEISIEDCLFENIEKGISISNAIINSEKYINILNCTDINNDRMFQRPIGVWGGNNIKIDNFSHIGNVGQFLFAKDYYENHLFPINISISNLSSYDLNNNLSGTITIKDQAQNINISKMFIGQINIDYSQNIDVSDSVFEKIKLNNQFRYSDGFNNWVDNINFNNCIAEEVAFFGNIKNINFDSCFFSSENQAQYTPLIGFIGPAKEINFYKSIFKTGINNGYIINADSEIVENLTFEKCSFSSLKINEDSILFNLWNLGKSFYYDNLTFKDCNFKTKKLFNVHNSYFKNLNLTNNYIDPNFENVYQLNGSSTICLSPAICPESAPIDNCFYDWQPVCGEDNNTYSNSCYASLFGVTIQSEGECSFEMGSYNLTYHTGSEGYIDGQSSQLIVHASDGTEVEAIPDEGYHFVSWSDGVMTASRMDTNVTENITVTANFEIGEAEEEEKFNNSITPINLEIQSTISISCDSTVSMNPIVSTGQSAITGSNEATCTVSTNNSGGYKLEWSASSIAMLNGTDTISAYTPTVADTPEIWSIASSASEWGARLKSTSTDTASEWGTADGYNASSNWLNVSTSPRQIVSRTFEASSSTQIIQFGAEIGSSKLQPTGEYQVSITLTATTL